MGRPLRTAQGGFVYHVLYRANDRKTIFRKASDYEAFGAIMAEVQERIPMRILAWCLMPNHWHLVLWPRLGGQLSEYVRLLTLAHYSLPYMRRVCQPMKPVIRRIIFILLMITLSEFVLFLLVFTIFRFELGKYLN